jgi:hypothetical protein
MDVENARASTQMMRSMESIRESGGGGTLERIAPIDSGR